MDLKNHPDVLEFQKEPQDTTAEDTLIRLLPNSGHYRALESRVKRKIAGLRQSVEDRPKINTQEIRYDIRYQLGMIAALKWVINQPVKNDLTRRE